MPVARIHSLGMQLKRLAASAILDSVGQSVNFKNALRGPIHLTAMVMKQDVTAPVEETVTIQVGNALVILGSMVRDVSTKRPCSKVPLVLIRLETVVVLYFSLLF